MAEEKIKMYRIVVKELTTVSAQHSGKKLSG